MSNILPESICWRVDKIGYEPPQKNWIQSKKFKVAIDKAAKELSIKKDTTENSNSVFTQEWRLLMASKFI